MGGDWIVISLDFLGFPFLSPLTYSPRPKSLGAERNEMKIISIKIVFESEEHTEESGEPGNSVPRSRLITANFREGEWSIDGPIYSRILLALHEVWQRLRQEVKNG